MKKFDVRVYGSDGLRKTFPSHKVDKVSWELLEQGYYGLCTIEFQHDFNDDLNLTGSDRIEVWYGGEIQFRGILGKPSTLLSEPETKSLSVYGLAHRCNAITVDRRWAYPGGVDISEVFASIASEYVAPRIENLILDIQNVGFEIEAFSADRKSARNAFGELVNLAAKRAVWGFDIDSDGNNRIFLRPKSTAVEYVKTVGEDVKAYSPEPDYTEIINKVYLTGAESKYPNLVVNPSFEQPIFISEPANQAIVNGGFENGLTGWSKSGSNTNVLEENPRSGSKALRFSRLDSNPYVQQASVDIAGGESHRLELWIANYYDKTGFVYVTITPDVGDPILFTLGDAFIWQTWYRRFTRDFIAPEGASSCTIRLTATDEWGFYVDDVALWQTSGLAEEGWYNDISSGVSRRIDWQYRDAHHGNYSVRLTPTIPKNGWIRILQSAGNAISVDNNYSYYIRFWNKGLIDMADQLPAVGKMYLRAWVTKSDGTGRWVSSEFMSLPNNVDGWVEAGHLVYTPEEDDQSFYVAIEVKNESSGSTDITLDMLIDAVEVTRGDLSTYSGPPLGMPFSAGKNVFFVLSTDDDFVQNDAELPDAVKSSITTNGIWDTYETIEGIATIEQAQNWAIGYFGLNAQPKVCHVLELENQDPEIKPDGLVQIDGSGIDPAFPVKVKYDISADLIKSSIELNTERPSFEGMLSKAIKQARKEAMGAVAGATSTAVAGGTGVIAGGGVHARLHDIDSEADHNGVDGADEDDIMVFDASGLPKSAGVSIAEVGGHDAATVADTDTLDLSIDGQEISGAVKKQMSIDSDASGLKLSGDSASPGNSKLYGTNGSGTKGWYDQPAGSLTDGDKGDITVSGSGATWTIDNDAVAYAKIQDVSATDKILGRVTAGAGIIEEITCTSAGRSILDDASVGDIRTTLGVGTGDSPTFAGATLTGILNGAQGAFSSATHPVLLGERITTQTSAARTGLMVTHKTSGNMADGFGSAIALSIKDDANVDNLIANIYGIRDGADNSGKFVFNLLNAGSGVDAFTIFKTGIVKPSGGYQSTDGTAGWTGSIALDEGTITVKNGLITGWA